MKLQGDKSGRKGQLSVATEVINCLIIMYYLFSSSQLHGNSLLVDKKLASSKIGYRMFKFLYIISFQALFNSFGYKKISG